MKISDLQRYTWI